MTILTKIATEIGTAVGNFETARAAQHAKAARHPQAGYLRKGNHNLAQQITDAIADEGRWTTGGSDDAAQRRALTSSWVYSALDIIYRIIAGSKINVMVNKGADSDPVAIHNHPFEMLLRNPNPYITRSGLWKWTAFWAGLSGNAYWLLSPQESSWMKAGENEYVMTTPFDAPRPALKYRDLQRNGLTIKEIWPLPSNTVRALPGEDGGLNWYEYLVAGKIFYIPAKYVFHYQLTNPYNLFNGLSPLVAAMLPMDSDIAMSRWNAQFFGKNNTMPSAIINLSSGDPMHPVPDSDREALEDELRDEYAAFERKTLVTNANSVSAKLLGWNAKDMDFLAGRTFSKDEIYTVFGIAPGYQDKNSTEANAKVAEAATKDAIWGGWMVPFAEAVSADILITFYGRNLTAEFDDPRPKNRELELQELDRGRGLLTVNEARETYYNLPPLDDERGEKLYGESQVLGVRDQGLGLPVLGNQYSAGVQSDGMGATEGETHFESALHLDKPLTPNSQPLTPDLQNWQRKALKALKRTDNAFVPFESDSIAPDVVEFVRASLPHCQSPAAVKALFDDALDYRQIKRAERTLINFERQMEMAVRFGMLQQMNAVVDVIERGGDPLTEQALWEAQERELLDIINPWVTDIALFGIEEGERRLPGEAGVSVNWGLVNRDAVERAQSHAAQMVRGITETTREQLRREIAASLEAGESQAKLVERIRASGAFSESRAKLIAQTETTQTYAQANAESYVRAGYPTTRVRPVDDTHIGCRCSVRPKKVGDNRVIVFYTANDSHVCTVPFNTPWGSVNGCRELHLAVVGAFDSQLLGRSVTELK